MVASMMDSVTESVQLYGAGVVLIVLVFVTFFALFGNGMVLWRIGRGNIRLAGGALAHVGFTILILGIIASSGFSTPITGETDASRANFILERGQSARVGDYVVTYSDRDTTDRGRPRYLLDFQEVGGSAFSLRPVVYQSNKSQWIQHPDIKLGVAGDLFVAVTPNKMLDDNTGRAGEVAMAMGDTLVVGDNEYELTFVRFEIQEDSEYHTDSTEIAVAAVLNVTNLATGEKREFKPLYLVDRSGTTRSVRNELPGWQFAVSFVGMNVDNGQVQLVLEGVSVEPEDWIVVQAMEKPLIILVWIGILMLSAGFVLAFIRRVIDQRLAVTRAAANRAAANRMA